MNNKKFYVFSEDELKDFINYETIEDFLISYKDHTIDIERLLKDTTEWDMLRLFYFKECFELRFRYEEEYGSREH